MAIGTSVVTGWGRTAMGLVVCGAVVASLAVGVVPASAAPPTLGFDLSVIAGDGTYGTPTPGNAMQSHLGYVAGPGVDSAGDVFFADQSACQIIKVSSGGTLSVIAGDGSCGAVTPGPALSSSLNEPGAVAVDSSGNLYVADQANEQIDKLTPSTQGGYTLSAIAGTGQLGTPTAGPATQSELNDPSDVAVDSAGNVYIADTFNSEVEKLTPTQATGYTLSVIGGNGNGGAPSAGPATQSPITDPVAVAVDSAGNIYVADTFESNVEKLTPSNSGDYALSVIAGTDTYGPPTPGPATQSTLDEPRGLAVDSSGDVFVSDEYNHDIEELTPPTTPAGDYTLSVIAGTGAYGSPVTGPATSSSFAFPQGVAVDPSGDVYVTDTENYKVEKLTPVRTATTVAVVTPQSVNYGAEPTASASVKPAVAGTMQFTLNGADVGSPVAVDSNGDATSPPLAGAGTSPLGAGTYTVGAVFTPTDSLNYQAGSGSASLVIGKATTTTTLQTPNGVVYGQAGTLSASVSPAIAGTIQFVVDGNNVGTSVAVDGSGSASTTVSGLAVGNHVVLAPFEPTDATDYKGSTGTPQALIVGPASTTTGAPRVSASTVSTTVSVVAPGAGTPTGTVTFAANGAAIGSAPVQPDGSATLAYTSHGATTISATYSGNTDFNASSNSTAVTNPRIAAKVTSGAPKTRYGWYRDPVTVTFTCAAGSAALSASCPAPVTLSRSGAAQRVTETIADTDGGIATVVVSGINIDRVRPKVIVTGIRNGVRYGAEPRIRCRTRSGPSGLTPRGCVVRTRSSGQNVIYTVTATSKAGLTATVRGHLRMRPVWIAGAAYRNGAYVMAMYRRYDLSAFWAGKSAPVLIYAAPAGAHPGPGHTPLLPAGRGLWKLPIALGRTPYPNWTIKVHVGRSTYTLAINLVS